MDASMTTSPLNYPLLRSGAIGAHGLLAGWLMLNGLAHQIGVLWKAQAGTLKPDASVGALLAVGAGLMIAGALATWTLGPLKDALRPSVVPALLAVAFLGAVLAGIAWEYGFTFLMGSITLAVLDLSALVAHALANGR